MSPEPRSRPGVAPVLEIDGLRVSYGGMRALSDVSLVVPEGAVVALLGANGAGKSTTLRAVSGLVRPEAGRILVDGVRVDHRPPHAVARLGVVHVPEGRGIFPGLDGAREPAGGGAPASDAAGDAGADPVEAAGEYFPVLRDRQRQLAGSLSGGEQQMLALARALLSRPRLLMVDEISMGLAPIVVAQLFDILRAAGRGRDEPVAGGAVRRRRARSSPTSPTCSTAARSSTSASRPTSVPAGWSRPTWGADMEQDRHERQRPRLRPGGGRRCRRRAATLGWGAAAQRGHEPTIAGYTLDAQALGFQFGFNIPGLDPAAQPEPRRGRRALRPHHDERRARWSTRWARRTTRATSPPTWARLLQTFGVPLPVPNDTRAGGGQVPDVAGLRARRHASGPRRRRARR